MKIYTKTGDNGKTSLLGGKRVMKSCLEMEAIGEVDELNSWLGVLIEEIEEKFKSEAKKLKEAQKCLFIIGAELASVQMDVRTYEKSTKLRTYEIKKIERWIDEMEKKLPKLNHFIAYEGTEEAVKAFYARAICRRAERAVIRLLSSDETSPSPLLRGEGKEIKKYLNRLSDVLFVLGRWFNLAAKLRK